MANEQRPEKLRFFDWLESIGVGPAGQSFFRFLNYKNHKLYPYWKATIEGLEGKEKRRRTYPFGFPDFTRKAYLDNLKIVMENRVVSGLATEEEAIVLYDEAYDRFTREGLHPLLPLFDEIVAPRMANFDREKLAEFYQNLRAYELERQRATREEEERARQFTAQTSIARLYAEQEGARPRTPSPRDRATFQSRLAEQLGERQRRLEKREQLFQIEQAMANIGTAPRDWINNYIAKRKLDIMKWELGGAGRERLGIQGVDMESTSNVLARDFLEEFERQRVLSEKPGFESEKPTRESVLGALHAADKSFATGRGGVHISQQIPETPLLPENLRQFFPGTERVSEFAAFTPPSAQAFRRLSATEQAQLAGALDFAAQRKAKAKPKRKARIIQPSFADFQKRLAESLPRTPRLGRRQTARRQIA